MSVWLVGGCLLLCGGARAQRVRAERTRCLCEWLGLWSCSIMYGYTIRVNGTEYYHRNRVYTM